MVEFPIVYAGDEYVVDDWDEVRALIEQYVPNNATRQEALDKLMRLRQAAMEYCAYRDALESIQRRLWKAREGGVAG